MKTIQMAVFALLGMLVASGVLAEVSTEHENVLKKAHRIREQGTVGGVQNSPAPAPVNPAVPMVLKPLVSVPLPAASPSLPVIPQKLVNPPQLIVNPVLPPMVAPIAPPVLTAMPILPVITPPPVIVIPPPPLILIPPPLITVPIVFVPPPRVYRTSDRRLKMNIHRVGTHRLGIGIYEYDYVWGEHAVGVMADEVRTAKPDAVLRGEDGYDRVDYSAL